MRPNFGLDRIDSISRNLTIMFEFAFDGEENIMEKGEKCCLPALVNNIFINVQVNMAASAR